MTTTQTAGQKLTATLTSTLHIGSRTRNRRGRTNLRNEVIETIQTAITYPGYWTKDRQDAIATGWTAVNAYRKHIEGGRADTIVCWYVREGMSPYQFAKLLGRMVDAGITTVFEAEAFFSSLRDEANAAYAKRY
jgi:hypothetical protein